MPQFLLVRFVLFMSSAGALAAGGGAELHREVAVMVKRTPLRDYYEDDYREENFYEDDERVRKRCRTRTGRRARAATKPKRVPHRLEQ